MKRSLKEIFFIGINIMIKLLLTDMDGTFLNNSGDLKREQFKDVKKLMREKGFEFAPVTG